MRYHPKITKNLSRFTVSYLGDILTLIQNSLHLEDQVGANPKLADYFYLCFDMLRGFESFMKKLCIDLPVKNPDNGFGGKMSLDRYFTLGDCGTWRFRSSEVSKDVSEAHKSIIVLCYDHYTSERNRRFHGGRDIPYTEPITAEEAVALNNKTLNLIEQSCTKWNQAKITQLRK